MSGPFVKPREKARGRYYEHVSPYHLVYGREKYEYVYLESTVTEKPKIITRIPPPITGEGHDHYTLFKIEEGIMIGFPGVAPVREGEAVKIYGKVSDKHQIIAEKIEAESGVYEIQI